MRGAGKVLLYVCVAAVAGSAGYLLQSLWQPNQTAPVATAAQIVKNEARHLMGARRPDFSLTDLGGRSRSIDEWDGKVVLVNFWATWCPPCRREIPEFMEVYKEFAPKGFVVLGIAIDERNAVQDFVAELGVQYPQLWGEQDAVELSIQYGNRFGALPYSVLIDRAGIIRYLHPGELRRSDLESELSKLL